MYCSTTDKNVDSPRNNPLLFLTIIYHISGSPLCGFFGDQRVSQRLKAYSYYMDMVSFLSGSFDNKSRSDLKPNVFPHWILIWFHLCVNPLVGSKVWSPSLFCHWTFVRFLSFIRCGSQTKAFSTHWKFMWLLSYESFDVKLVRTDV